MHSTRIWILLRNWVRCTRNKLKCKPSNRKTTTTPTNKQALATFKLCTVAMCSWGTVGTATVMQTTAIKASVTNKILNVVSMVYFIQQIYCRSLSFLFHTHKQKLISYEPWIKKSHQMSERGQRSHDTKRNEFFVVVIITWLNNNKKMTNSMRHLDQRMFVRQFICTVHIILFECPCYKLGLCLSHSICSLLIYTTYNNVYIDFAFYKLISN